MRIATFNLWHGFRLERGIEVVLAEPRLADADVLALQEADEAVAERFAGALGMKYICARGAVHPRTGRGFGPVLLSRWPMEDPEQLELPHRGIHGILRTAVAATVHVAGEPVRAYAVHFGNMREMLPMHQAAQARVVLARAAARTGLGIVAGDLNRKGLGHLFHAAGWRWVTRDVGVTHRIWSFDHVFVRGYDDAAVRTGSVRAALAASDHRAVWAEVDRQPPRSPGRSLSPGDR